MRRAGFSLIEALVALAIASVSLLAIFDLQQQMTKAQRRLEVALNQSRLERSAMAALQDLNPTQRPTGEIEMGTDAKLSWTSAPLSEEKLSAGFPTGNGSFRVRLYRVTLHIADENGQPVGDYQIDRVGWRKVFQTPGVVPY